MDHAESSGGSSVRRLAPDEERLAELIRLDTPGELWDVYDAAGRKTGRVQRRGDPLGPGDFHLCIHVWIVNARGEYLLTQRAPGKSMAGLWECTGGSALLGEDSLTAALREVREETGVASARLLSEDIFSLESLTVDGHEKHGAYVPSHLHLNVTYLLEADDRDPLTVCEEENSGVRWFTLDGALEASSEPWFVSRIYRKLNEKLKRNKV